MTAVRFSIDALDMSVSKLEESGQAVRESERQTKESEALEKVQEKEKLNPRKTLNLQGMHCCRPLLSYAVISHPFAPALYGHRFSKLHVEFPKLHAI